MKKIAIFASGSGTNAENIARIFNGGSRVRVTLVLTNRRKAGVIARMDALDVPVRYVPNEVWDQRPAEIVSLLEENDIDIVVLAGFMHYVPEEIVEAFKGRILNIHPSLLPAYGGKGMYGHYVHEAVIAARESKSGVTVHLVTPQMDEGEIIMQQSVDITPEDTPATLEAKIHPIEYDIYPRAIVRLIDRLENESKGDHPAVGDAKSGGEPENLSKSWAEALGVPLPSEPLMPPVPVSPEARQVETPEEDGMDGMNGDSSVPPVAGESVVPPGASPVTLNAEHPDHPMPKTYMAWAIVATLLCCIPTGIVAIIYSSQVSNKYYSGDFEGARRSSERAEIWIIASIVAGVIFTTLYTPLTLLIS